jgi:hypothetical protein
MLFLTLNSEPRRTKCCEYMLMIWKVIKRKISWIMKIFFLCCSQKRTLSAVVELKQPKKAARVSVKEFSCSSCEFYEALLTILINIKPFVIAHMTPALVICLRCTVCELWSCHAVIKNVINYAEDNFCRWDRLR